MFIRKIHSLVAQLNITQKLMRNLEGCLEKKGMARILKRYYTVSSGTPGEGAGKGGGAGGSVRESGGGLGKYGAAQEEGYFFNKKREQLEKIKEKMKKEAEETPPIKAKEEKGDN